MWLVVVPQKLLHMGLFLKAFRLVRVFKIAGYARMKHGLELTVRLRGFNQN